MISVKNTFVELEPLSQMPMQRSATDPSSAAQSMLYGTLFDDTVPPTTPKSSLSSAGTFQTLPSEEECTREGDADSRQEHEEHEEHHKRKEHAEHEEHKEHKERAEHGEHEGHEKDDEKEEDEHQEEENDDDDDDEWEE